MIRLPHWVITDRLPAIYDHESGTAIEQTAKVYGAMNELIDEYNKFVDHINETVEAFINNTNGDYEIFKVAIRQEFQDFIDVVNLKAKSQDNVINNAVLYMKANLGVTIGEMISGMRESGELNEVIVECFEDFADQINAETTARSLADENLVSMIQNEILDRENADNALSEAIANESYARESAVNTLNEAISNETLTRETSNENLQKAIDNEALRINNVLNEIENLSETQNTISPLMYGAKGDGVADDTNAFVEAFNNLQKGDTLYIPSGVYIIKDSVQEGYLDTGIVLKSNINIVGDGIGKTIIKSNNGYLHVLNGTNVENINISDLTIDGNRQDYSGGTHCLRFSGAKNINISRCRFINAQRYGIAFALGGSAEYITINQCQFDNIGADGIDFKNELNLNKHISITDCKFTNIGTNPDLNYQCCIDIRGENVVIDNILAYNLPYSSCVVRMRETNEDQGTGGIYNIISNVKLEGLQPSGAGTGIICYGNTIVSNSILKGVSVGVQTFSNCIIDNIIIDNCNDGIRTNGDNVLISNCIIKNCTTNGIRISHNNVHVFNSIIDTCKRGFFFNSSETVNDIKLIGNSVYNAQIAIQGEFSGINKCNNGMLNYNGVNVINVVEVGSIETNFNVDLEAIPPIKNMKIVVECSNSNVKFGFPVVTSATKTNVIVTIPILEVAEESVLANVYLEIEG